MLKELTQEQLFSQLSYDKETGIFKRKEDRNWFCSRGDTAGYVTTTGHRVIRVLGTKYRAHRLAWLYVYGKNPTLLIDHRDGDGDNNSISNLRLATHSQNAFNTGLPKINTSGHKGIYKVGKLWLAQAKLKGKTYKLGKFSDKVSAAEAYRAFARENHGEFYKELNLA